MGIKVKATAKGLGTCRVYLMHDDLGQDEQLEDLASFKITASHRVSRAAAPGSLLGLASIRIKGIRSVVRA